MGMYTGLRVKVTVKKDYRDMIEAIHNGDSWCDYAEEFPFLANYAKQGRAEFIPNGVLSYMPDNWEEGEFPRQKATDGFGTKIDLATGKWSFQCSLKNYNDEIEQFFEEVLPHLLESSEHIEYFYEEWEESKMYEFANGNIVQLVK